MLHPQLTLSLHRELVIDNFAGGGGASTGIEPALGRPSIKKPARKAKAVLA